MQRKVLERLCQPVKSVIGLFGDDNVSSKVKVGLFNPLLAIGLEYIPNSPTNQDILDAYVLDTVQVVLQRFY